MSKAQECQGEEQVCASQDIDLKSDCDTYCAVYMGSANLAGPGYCFSSPGSDQRIFSDNKENYCPSSSKCYRDSTRCVAVESDESVLAEFQKSGDIECCSSQISAAPRAPAGSMFQPRLPLSDITQVRKCFCDAKRRYVFCLQ